LYIPRSHCRYRALDAGEIAIWRLDVRHGGSPVGTVSLL
jgi:hypothetical protein